MRWMSGSIDQSRPVRVVALTSRSCNSRSDGLLMTALLMLFPMEMGGGTILNVLFVFVVVIIDSNIFSVCFFKAVSDWLVDFDFLWSTRIFSVWCVCVGTFYVFLLSFFFLGAAVIAAVQSWLLNIWI